MPDARMPGWTLNEITVAIRASWSAETRDPAEEHWCEANPARGQCGTTALVVNDLLGGDLILADVLWPDGSRQGFHYWNRLPDGSEVDLTLEQFTAGEVVQAGRVVARPPGQPRRCAEQYAVLRERVLARLPERYGSHSNPGGCRDADLGIAVASNVIGQAQGVLSERYGMDAEEAFRALVGLSQEHNRKLHEVARRPVEATVADRGASSRHPIGPDGSTASRDGAMGWSRCSRASRVVDDHWSRIESASDLRVYGSSRGSAESCLRLPADLLRTSDRELPW